MVRRIGAIFGSMVVVSSTSCSSTSVVSGFDDTTCCSAFAISDDVWMVSASRSRFSFLGCWVVLVIWLFGNVMFWLVLLV